MGSPRAASEACDQRVIESDHSPEAHRNRWSPQLSDYRSTNHEEVPNRVNVDLTMDLDDASDNRLTHKMHNGSKTTRAPKVEPREQNLNLDDIIDFHQVAAEQGHGIPNDGDNGLLKPEIDEVDTDNYNMFEDHRLPDLDCSEPYVEDIDSEDEHVTESAKFMELKAKYQLMVKHRKNLVDHDIAFQRAQKAEWTRTRRREERQGLEYGCDSLFIPEDEGITVSTDQAPLSYHEVDVRRPDRESFCSQDLDATDDGSTTPKHGHGRLKGNGPHASQKHNNENKLKKVANKAGVRKKAQPRRGKKSNALAAPDFSTLFDHNLIAQAQKNKGLASQPTLGAGNKQAQLAALISSLPEEERDLYGSDKVALNNATKQFRQKGIIKAAGEDGWKHRDMKSYLYHHQLLAAAWMRGRENASPEDGRGGILADQMGFGKTVITIANIVDGIDPRKTSTPCQATLVVTPPSLIDQWYSEFYKHAGPELAQQVVRFRSSSHLEDFSDALARSTVVITSYHQVAKSMPKNDPPSHIHTAEAKAMWWRQHFEENKGLLHRVPWLRVVLDEAQAIKNPVSQTSLGVRALQGTYRWCLSGTPVQNGIAEFYAYFDFLKDTVAGPSFELFKKNFCKIGSDMSMQRLQTLLSKYMYRRTHESRLFGRPILTLPPIKPIETIQVVFNPVERAVYQIVKNRFCARIAGIRARDLKHKTGRVQSYNQLFVLLLRLRQLVGHPLLIQKTLKEVLEAEDMERLWRITESRADAPIDVEEDDGSNATVHALQVALTTANASNSTSTGKNYAMRDNMLSQNFRKYLVSLRKDGNWADLTLEALCHSCGNHPGDPYITSCMHLYCFNCLKEMCHQDDNEANETINCLECGVASRRSDASRAIGFEEAMKGKQLNLSDKEDEGIDWYTIEPMLRSAKIKAAAEKIRAWLTEDSTRKIVVFAQFRGMIRIMERVCREEGWGCATFDGSMSFEAREESKREFSDDARCQILLTALKAGGVGLNLTAGSRCIILDLWFNACAEAQAYCRIWRLGQSRDVEVVRFVVKDSIDQNIIRMQERKAAEIDNALNENSRRNLTIPELLELFGGCPERDANKPLSQRYGPDEDEPFVFPDTSSYTVQKVGTDEEVVLLDD